MPTQVSYPGVYIEEVPSGVHTITGVSTSIAAFIDFFKEGPMNEAVQIFGMTDFNRVYGGLDDRSEASYAIYQFFLNGGTEAHVVRVASGAGANAPEKANIGIKAGTSAGANIIARVEARNEGIWGNNLRVTIDYNTTDPTQLFNLYVTRHGSPSAQASVLSVEKYLNLSVSPTHPRYFKSVVNDESDLIRVEHITIGTSPDLPASNGTLSKPIDHLTTPAQFQALKGKQFKIKIGGSAERTAVLNWDAPDPTNLRELRPHLERAIRTADPNSPAFTGATVDLIGNRFLVRSGRGDPNYSPAEIIAISNASAADTLAETLRFAGTAGTGTLNENVQEYVLGATPPNGNVAAQFAGQQNNIRYGVAGNDGQGPDANAIKGDRNRKTGLAALEDVDLFNILCIPHAADLPDTEMTAVVSDALDYCEDRRAFMVIDIPRNINEVQEVKDWLDAHSGFRHKNAALYFPRLMMPDPLNEYRLRSVGASGTVAGLYARIDGSRGVWKAPAGTEASLRGIVGLETKLTDVQNGTLNPLAINCLRNFPVYGDVSWGSRTLVGSDLAGSEWKYIPIRRLALFLEESLFRGTKWVVFEPNDEPLWAQIRLNLNAFMMGLFRQGAFQGSTPDKAFYVKCDGETTTQADRNLGIVNIEVGFAPLKPAEFVVIKIQQIPGEL
jgi:phage tail sheath protein FI